MSPEIDHSRPFAQDYSVQVSMGIGERTACYCRVSAIVVGIEKLPGYNDTDN